MIAEQDYTTKEAVLPVSIFRHVSTDTMCMHSQVITQSDKL